MTSRYCRVCFERDEDQSKLISPCECRGSSLYIHIHCLEIWQTMSLENNNPIKAFYCPVCLSRFSHPSFITRLYKRVLYIAKYRTSIILKYFINLCKSYLVRPLKVFLHLFLVIVTGILGQVSIGDMSLAWVGCEFPPQLALIHTDLSDNQVCNIPPGMLLVASTLMEEQSMFYQSVVLILAHDPEESTKGVILNLSANLNQQPLPNPQPFSNIPNYSGTNEIKGLCDAVRLNIGGPIETDFFVVLHNDPNCNKHSTEVRWRRNDEEPLTATVQNSPEEDSNTNAVGQRSSKQHRLFFAEYEAAFQTMRLWSAEHSPPKNMHCDTASSPSSDHFSGDWRERERGLLGSEREVYSGDGGSSSGSGVHVPRLLRPSKRQQQHRSYDSVLKADNTSHSHSNHSSSHFGCLNTGMSSSGAPCSAAPCMSVFRGHCTWAPGQLAGELQAGLWLVASDEKIKARVLGAAGACGGSSSSSGMWNSLLRQLDDHW